MNIDKQKLKALAEAAGMAHGWYQETSFGLRGVSGRSEQAFIAAASPSAILALLAEIQRLEREADQAKADGADAFGLAQGRADTIDQLKSENEALRRIISESATACGAAVSVECSLEFMQHLPGEIALVIGALRKDAERWRFVRNAVPNRSPFAVWREGSLPFLGSKADEAVDAAMAREVSR